jgi:hypothetical protein
MFVAAALALCISGSESAQSVPDQRTFFTFSAPVALPGVTLPAGKYTFRLADSQTNRHIVQVFSADGKKIFATLMAIPAQRRDIPNDPEIQFRETPADSPAAIDVWYYPGTKTGHEFLYSKSDSAKWAKAKSDSAKIAKGQIAPDAMVFSNADVKAAAEPTPVTPVPEVSRPSTPIAAEVRPDTTMADSSASMNARANRSALPHTASSLPLVGTLGLLSLLAGVAVSSLRRRAQA